MCRSLNKHGRRSTRLKDYDYSREGAYFITICAQNRKSFFGEIIEGEMLLNDAGSMIREWWLRLSDKCQLVETDEYVIMPNHLHGIVLIVGADQRVRPPKNNEGEHVGSPLRPSLSQVIQWFKTMTTNDYIKGVKNKGWPAFEGRLWQRNYYDHIIRNESELNQIRRYIIDNPEAWELDKYHPSNP
jgi:putative transposase